MGDDEGDRMIPYLIYLVIVCLCLGFVWGVSVAQGRFDRWAYASICMSSLVLGLSLCQLWEVLA